MFRKPQKILAIGITIDHPGIYKSMNKIVLIPYIQDEWTHHYSKDSIKS